MKLWTKTGTQIPKTAESNMTELQAIKALTFWQFSDVGIKDSHGPEPSFQQRTVCNMEHRTEILRRGFRESSPLDSLLKQFINFLLFSRCLLSD